MDFLGLHHLLRTGEAHSNSFCVSLHHPIAKGEVVVSDGKICWARVGRADGEEALRKLVSWTGTKFTLYPLANIIESEGALSPGDLLEKIELPEDLPPIEGFARIRGELGAIGLREILHILWKNGRAARIRLDGFGQKGEIEVDSGKVVSASLDGKTGKDAVESLMQIPGGKVEITPGLSDVESDGEFSIESLMKGPALSKQFVLVEEDEPETGPAMTLAAKPMKVQLELAKKGNYKERIEAACSGRDQVAFAVVEDRNLPPKLIEMIAGLTRVKPVVLEFLATDPSCRRSYTVTRALVFNPSTPAGNASELLVYMRDADLRKISQDTTTYHESLRIRATRLLGIRKQKRSF